VQVPINTDLSSLLVLITAAVACLGARFILGPNQYPVRDFCNRGLRGKVPINTDLSLAAGP
jgi:hypothetical protein